MGILGAVVFVFGWVGRGVGLGDFLNDLVNHRSMGEAGIGGVVGGAPAGAGRGPRGVQEASLGGGAEVGWDWGIF